MNICAQLIAAYGLKYTTLPPEAGKDAEFLTKLLDQVAQVVWHVVIEQEFHLRSSDVCRATSKSIWPRWSS